MIRGHCVEGFGGKEAYYPILEALGQLFLDTGDSSNLQTFSKRAPTWLVQFPSLVKAEQREALEKEIIGATRERMVREICEALETITSQNPLLLCLEDLHWVDPSTLDFISALARRLGPAKLLLLATYRPAEVIISRSPLKALKQDLVLHNLSREISLERLEESDVAEYLAIEFVDANFPDGFAKVIFGHSGGNALFMVTILQDMVKKGLIGKTDGRWKLTVPLEKVDPSVPETLDQLIEAEFNQLGAVEQRILRSASVAGDRFPVWAITTAAELELSSIEEVCEALAARLQFIKCVGTYELANGQISAHYEFRHSLYREVLYRRISEVSRLKLHRLLAERLQAFCNPCEQELATELALHFEGGREYEQAIRYLKVAADNAAGRFAYRDSIEILQHALELVTKLSPALRAESEVQILEFIGDAQYKLGAMAESAEAYAAAASRADHAGLKVAQVRALSRALNPLGFINPNRCLATMDQAVKVSSSLDDPLLFARTQMLAATFRLVFDDWRQKDAELCASAYATVQRLGDSASRSYMRVFYAHVLTLQGNYAEALEIFETAISQMDHRTGMNAQYIAVLGKTQVLLRTGQLGEVLRIARAERKLAEKNGSAPWLFDFREAWVRTLVFDFAGTLQICQTTCAPRAVYIAAQLQTIGRMAAAYLELDRREYDRAIELYAQVGDPDVTPKFLLHWIWRLTAQLETSNAWLLAGNVPKARTTAKRFHESALSTADPHFQALAWELNARVAMAENDWMGSQKSIEQALAVVNKTEILVAAWQVHATAWLVYQKAKEHKKAKAHRDRAESCILRIAHSFDPDEPLRAKFLAAAPIRRILGKKSYERGNALGVLEAL
jgi:tetratricopeptide (TPR) repeat protein